MNVKYFKEEIQKHLDDDYVMLFTFLGLANEIHAGGLEFKRQQVLEIIYDMLKEKKIVAGEPDAFGGFEEWQGNPEDIVDRIEKEWKALKEPLNLCDVCWFKKIG